jgi:tRNA-specific 2-thiouridylase
VRVENTDIITSMIKKVKALVLFSGGLDSILAVKLLEIQGVKVTGLTYKSCFFDEKTASKAAKTLKITLKIVDISHEHLDVVKNPPHGYGKAANPCIDCHTLMLIEAKKMMKKSSYDFVATGEVLGERPFSQNYQALLKIQELSGLREKLLRPLSARLLPVTLPERRGWVDREKLGDIQGRTRHKQLALAKKYRIKDFPQPAGGCILCEPVFATKLFDLLKNKPLCTVQDINLLRVGRQFWIEGAKTVLGRNKGENERLVQIAQKGDIIIEPKNFNGPTALIRGKKINRSICVKVEQKILFFSGKNRVKNPAFLTIKK